jgi:hypothetical protein
MIQNHVDNENKIVTVHQKITHDFVLDIYEQSLHVDDPVQREAIIETARLLSASIGDYLTEDPINKDTKD